jgi:PleD family two-component response regulator
MAVLWNPSSEDAQMKEASEEMMLKALLVVESSNQVSRLMGSLSKKGISATIITDPDEALDECRRKPPHLAIVASVLGTVTGVRFLAELLKISWTTSTILISDEEEETVHDLTEGLGILGSIRTVDDMESLNKLIDRFLEIVSRGEQLASAGL